MDNDELEIIETHIQVDGREKFAKKLAVVSLALAVIFSGTATTAYLVHRSKTKAEVDSLLASLSKYSSGGDTSWVPAGYRAWSSDSNVAYKWVNDQSCSEFTCTHASFVTQNGCTSFYAAVNFLDSAGNVIGYGNATLPSLQPMQAAVLRFDDTSNSSKSSQMSEINCR